MPFFKQMQMTNVCVFGYEHGYFKMLILKLDEYFRSNFILSSIHF